MFDEIQQDSGRAKATSERSGNVRRDRRHHAVLVLVGLALFASTGCPQDLPARPVYRKFDTPKEAATPTTIDPATKEMHEKAKALRDRRTVELMREVFVKDDERTCTKDDDCTLTNEHCCGCNAMGHMTAIRSDRLAGLVQRRQELCKGFVCSAGMSTDPSCAPISAVCLDNKCVPNPKEMGDGVKGIGVEPITDMRARRPTQ